MMLAIFGNETAGRVLLYVQNYGEGHARAIAQTYEISHSVAQKQLLRLEVEGVLVSQLKGRTRVFTWNPRYALRAELSVLLEKALSLLPPEDRERWFMKRMRPRRTGKAL
jgi:DNA-binding GntR family transcriptional regulator